MCQISADTADSHEMISLKKNQLHLLFLIIPAGHRPNEFSPAVPASNPHGSQYDEDMAVTCTEYPGRRPVSVNNWNGKQTCQWNPLKLQVMFDFPIYLHYFSFESEDGMQPTSYAFYSGACDNETSLKLLVDNTYGNAQFWGKFDPFLPAQTFCFEIRNVSGYSFPGVDGFVRQNAVSMQNIKFWKCMQDISLDLTTTFTIRKREFLMKLRLVAPRHS